MRCLPTGAPVRGTVCTVLCLGTAPHPEARIASDVGIWDLGRKDSMVFRDPQGRGISFIQPFVSYSPSIIIIIIDNK